MNNVVSAINTGLSADNIWGSIALIVPLVLTITLVALGRKVANRNLNRATSGKSGRV